MSKRLNDEDNYPFHWLDETVELTLNPSKTKPEDLSPAILQEIDKRLPGEFASITASLKNQAFSLYFSEQIKVVTGQYDQAVQLLLRQSKANLMLYPAGSTLHQTGESLLKSLEALESQLHQRYAAYLAEPTLPPAHPVKDRPAVQRTVFKLLCKLSVDQIGLVLKAADDLKIIVARSLSQVYKTIVPFLSTDNQEEISWDSMRSSTYHPEEVDKEAVINVLEKMINKIRGY